MSTETLKISLAQKILSITDSTLLIKLKALIEKENIVGYNAYGKAVAEKDYIEEMDRILDEIDRDEAVFFTTEALKKSIIDENNLA